MKKALVLGGGGAKGAYQAGCIKALNELNITFDIITGTSIGALHTLLYVMEDFETIEKLWHTITIKDVILDPINLPDSIDDVFNDFGELTSFIKNYVSNKGVDITPLKQLLNKLYKPEKIKKQYDFGFVTMKYPQLEPLFITNKEMNKENTIHYALASASCFPIFPIHKINDQGYIDGGYYDNLPIELAINMLATDIVAIPLSKKSLHLQYLNRPNIKHIMPYKKLGDLLDFDKNLLDLQYTLGYNDTCKAYNKFIGFYYTFTPLNQIEISFYQNILSFENEYCKLNKATSLPITSYLIEHCNKQVLEIQDYSIITIESICSLKKYEIELVYDYNRLKTLFYNEFKSNYYQNNQTRLNDSLDNKIIYYYNLMKQNKFEQLYKDCFKNQQAITIALYYYSI